MVKIILPCVYVHKVAFTKKLILNNQVNKITFQLISASLCHHPHSASTGGTWMMLAKIKDIQDPKRLDSHL